jgi:hypothetical protein
MSGAPACSKPGLMKPSGAHGFFFKSAVAEIQMGVSGIELVMIKLSQNTNNLK